MCSCFQSPHFIFPQKLWSLKLPMVVESIGHRRSCLLQNYCQNNIKQFLLDANCEGRPFCTIFLLCNVNNCFPTLYLVAIIHFIHLTEASLCCYGVYVQRTMLDSSQLCILVAKSLDGKNIRKKTSLAVYCLGEDYHQGVRERARLFESLNFFEKA